jgi:hypothetical protein
MGLETRRDAADNKCGSIQCDRSTACWTYPDESMRCESIIVQQARAVEESNQPTIIGTPVEDSAESAPWT